MRTLAALFGILAVTVWWGPLPVSEQSLLLALVAFMCLACRRATFPPRGAAGKMASAAAAPADPQARSES